MLNSLGYSVIVTEDAIIIQEAPDLKKSFTMPLLLFHLVLVWSSHCGWGIESSSNMDEEA